MKCPSCGTECERGMRLTFRFRKDINYYGDSLHYLCETPGVGGHINLPPSLDEPAQTITVFVEGAG